MQPRHCAGCGAPLPPLNARSGEDSTITCRFCGLVHALDAPPQAVHVTWKRQGSSTFARVVGAVGIVLGLAGFVVGLVVAWRDLQGRSPVAVATDPARAGAQGAITLEALRSIPAGRHRLDVPPPSGGLNGVDAVAQAPWALGLAQRWAPDARLERIDVKKLTLVGTVPVSTDAEAEVRYRFVSPAAIRTLREERATSTRARGVTGLFLELADGQAYVHGTTTGDPDDSPTAGFPDAVPVGQLMPLVLDDPRFRVPFLSGYLIHLEHEGWVWYFSTLSGESLPRVRARDGAIWPYPGSTRPGKPRSDTRESGPGMRPRAR